MALNECDRQLTTRFINSNHHPSEARARIILRSTKQCSDSTTSSGDCTLRSVWGRAKYLYAKLDATRTDLLSHSFFIEMRENNDIDDAVFILDGAEPLHDGCDRHSLGFRPEPHRNRNRVKYNFVRCYVEIPDFLLFWRPEAETANERPRRFSFK